MTDDYTLAKQKAKVSEDTFNISSSNLTHVERLTRFQKTKKKVMKNDIKKREKLKRNTDSLDSPCNTYLYLFCCLYVPILNLSILLYSFIYRRRRR